MFSVVGRRGNELPCHFGWLLSLPYPYHQPVDKINIAVNVNGGSGGGSVVEVCTAEDTHKEDHGGRPNAEEVEAEDCSLNPFEH